MTAIEKIRALNTVTVIDEDDPKAQNKIDTLEGIGAKYKVNGDPFKFKIGIWCEMFRE